MVSRGTYPLEELPKLTTSSRHRLRAHAQRSRALDLKLRRRPACHLRCAHRRSRFSHLHPRRRTLHIATHGPPLATQTNVFRPAYPGIHANLLRQHRDGTHAPDLRLVPDGAPRRRRLRQSQRCSPLTDRVQYGVEWGAQRSRAEGQEAREQHAGICTRLRRLAQEEQYVEVAGGRWGEVLNEPHPTSRMKHADDEGAEHVETSTPSHNTHQRTHHPRHRYLSLEAMMVFLSFDQRALNTPFELFFFVCVFAPLFWSFDVIAGIPQSFVASFASL